MDDEELYVDVTNDDIRAARAAWLAAREGGASQERVDLLRADLEHLWRLQAHEIAAAFRQRRVV